MYSIFYNEIAYNTHAAKQCGVNRFGKVSITNKHEYNTQN
jgi:hypothetical protein